MEHLVKPLMLLLLTIILYGLYDNLRNRYRCKNLKNMSVCKKENTGASCRNDPNCCVMWDEKSKECKKGTLKDGVCNIKDYVGIDIVGVLAVISLVLTIISFIVSFRR